MIGAQLTGLRVNKGFIPDSISRDTPWMITATAPGVVAIHDNGWGKPGTADVGGHESPLPMDATMRQCFGFFFRCAPWASSTAAARADVLACMEWNGMRHD